VKPVLYTIFGVAIAASLYSIGTDKGAEATIAEYKRQNIKPTPLLQVQPVRFPLLLI
jgi:hypothetical protein